MRQDVSRKHEWVSATQREPWAVFKVLGEAHLHTHTRGGRGWAQATPGRR